MESQTAQRARKLLLIGDLLIMPAAFNMFRPAGRQLRAGQRTCHLQQGHWGIILFIALYVAFGKYVRQEDLL